MKLAFVEEAACVGCTKCLAVCPVDAILGCEGWMHTVIQQECIGCELCVPVCPVDCITLLSPPKTYRKPGKVHIQERIQARQERLEKKCEAVVPLNKNVEEKKRYIQAVLTK